MNKDREAQGIMEWEFSLCSPQSRRMREKNNKTCKPSCHFRAVFTWSVRVRSLQRRYTSAYRASHPVQIYTLHLFSFNIHTHNAYFINAYTIQRWVWTELLEICFCLCHIFAQTAVHYLHSTEEILYFIHWIIITLNVDTQFIYQKRQASK